LISVEVDLPCYFLHLDAIDSLGFSQLDINLTANFRRYTKAGRFIGVAKNVPPQVSLDEKCMVKGKVSVNKVLGNFHIASGRNLVDLSVPAHQHDLSFAFPSLDMSLRIERIRFGPSIPTANTPLTDMNIRQRPGRPMFYRYSTLVAPLVYIKNGREKDRGYESTAMIAQRAIAPGMVPGIFFDYAFTPYAVVVHAKSKSFAQYLTSTFGFLSGSFSAVMLLNMFLQTTQIVEKWKKPKSEEDETK
jgi:hypothetical protein